MSVVCRHPDGYFVFLRMFAKHTPNDVAFLLETVSVKKRSLGPQLHASQKLLDAVAAVVSFL